LTRFSQDVIFLLIIVGILIKYKENRMNSCVVFRKSLIAGTALVCVNLIAAVPNNWRESAFLFHGNGDPRDNGSVAYTDAGELNLTVTGAGNDIWGQDDSGYYAFTPVAGDFDLIATVPSIPEIPEHGEWLRMGLLLRGSLRNNAYHLGFLRVKGTAGNRFKLQRRLADATDTGNWPVNADLPYANGQPVRMRMIRQANTFTAWASTNAPAYDVWAQISSSTFNYPQAVNIGVTVSKHSGTTLPQVTFGFTNVVARNLVVAETNAAGVLVSWIDDLPLVSGTNSGYVVRRALAGSTSFLPIATTPLGVVTNQDLSVATGPAYIYQIYAMVDNGGTVTETLLGSSLPVRKPVANATLAPSIVKGIATEYIQPNGTQISVGARVDPTVNNSWNADLNNVYPVGTFTGLGALDNFEANYSGSITPVVSGTYGFSVIADDVLRIWVDGIQVVDHAAYYSEKRVYSAPVYMEAGRSYSIKGYFREGGGGEMATLYWYRGGAADAILAQSYLEPFPNPWSHSDLGQSDYFGNASYDFTGEVFTSVSAGSGVSGVSDSAHLIWQTSALDFDIIASAEILGGVAGSGAGVMVCQSRSASDISVGVSLLPSGDVLLSHRAAAGAAAATATYPVIGSDPELRISRRGSAITVSYRTAGNPWYAVTNLTTAITGTACAGLHSFSGDLSTVVTARFDAVSFFDASGPAFTAVQSGAEVDFTVTADVPSYYREQNSANANNKYYFVNEYAFTTNFAILKSERADGLYAPVTAVARGTGGTASDTITEANTMTFYKLGLSYDFGPFSNQAASLLDATSAPNGFSYGTVAGSGSGLYAAAYTNSNIAPPTQPMHTKVYGMTPWNQDNGEFAPGQGIDNIVITFSGRLMAPVTGWYWFGENSDDGVVMVVKDKVMINHTGYLGRPSYSAEPVFMEAGERVPIYIFYREGTGGANFRFYWNYTALGSATAAYVDIPTQYYYPLAAGDAPWSVAPGGAAAFGEWTNIDINSGGRAGHAILGGTPEVMDCKVLASGNDIWGTSDGLHFVYQEIALNENFEISCRMNTPLQADGWSKAALMIRENTTSGSRNIALLQSATNGRHLQRRTAQDGTTYNYDTTGNNQAMMNDSQYPKAGPVQFKMVKESDTLTCYYNDQAVPAGQISVADWSNLLVGVALTSHNTGAYSEVYFSDVVLKIIPPKGTLFIVR